MATARLEDIEDQTQASTASGRASLADIDDPNAPGAKEVEKAVRSVPRPSLDYMQTEQTLRSPIPQAPTPVTPEAEQFQKDVQAGVNKKRQPAWKTALGVATEAATNPSMTTGGPSTEGGKGAQVQRGVEQLATPGQRGTGALNLAEAATEAATPLMGPAALENPVSIAKGLAEGTVASKAAEKISEKAGANKEQQDLISSLAFWAPGVARSVFEPKVGVQSSPEGSSASVTMRGAGAGIALTPEEIVLRGGIAGRQGEVRIPRGGQQAPALEPQTIEGQTVEPEPHPATTATAIQNEETQAMRMASGLPPVEPAPPAPAPPKIHEVGPEDVADLLQTVGKLPENVRAQALLEAHETLANVLMQQGKVVGPDGKIVVITKPDQATKVATDWINEAVEQQQKAAEEQAKASVKEGKTVRSTSGAEEKPVEAVQTASLSDIVEEHGEPKPAVSVPVESDESKGAPVPGAGTGHVEHLSGGVSGRAPSGNEPERAKEVSESTQPAAVAPKPTEAQSAPSQAPKATQWKKGDKVVTKGGQEGTVEYASPTMRIVRVKDEAGNKVTVSGKDVDELQQAPKYKFGSTQANIPEGSEAHTALQAARERIPESDLAGKGKETESHVTVRYGIKGGTDTSKIKKFISEQAPFEATLGKTEKFEPTEHSDGAAVIKAPIESPELHRINAELEKHGDFTEPSFKGYKPHATIAYVKPEKANRYVGMDVTHGKKFTVKSIAITDRNGNQEEVELKGKGTNATESHPVAANVTNAEPIREPEHPHLDVGEHREHTEMVATPTVAKYANEHVQMVPTHELDKYKEYDRRETPHPGREKDAIDRLKEDIAKNGLTEPLILKYGYEDRKAHLWEGNHRLAAAKELGIKELPVRVITSPKTEDHFGVPVAGHKGEGKPAADLRPSEVGIEARALGEPKAEQPKPKHEEPSELKPGQVGEMKVSDLKLAPNRFQYKLNTDTEGVGTLLKNVKKFQPDLAGIISVWKDPADGKFYVINGHHRFELAKRTGQKTVAVRHIKAADAAEARAVGARQNIAEGRGTPIDAAKFFRETGITPEKLEEHGISLGEATARKGMALANLDQSLFNKVVDGNLSLGRAVAIGEATQDHAEQKAILDLVNKKEARGQKISDGTLSELVRFVKESGQQTETTADLFGMQEVNRSLALEKAEVSDYIKQQLAKDKRLFGFVAKTDRAKELQRAGNVIDVDKSKEISEGAAQAEEVYNRLSGRGGDLATVLDEAARKLAESNSERSKSEIKRDAYERVRAAVQKILGTGTGSVSEGLEAGTGRREAAKGNSGKSEGSVNLYSTEPYKWPDLSVDNKAYQQALSEIGQGKSFAELSADERHKVYAEAQRLKEQMLGKKVPNLYSPDAPAPVFYSKAQIVAFDKVTNNASGSSILATLKNNGVKEDEIKWLGLDDFLKGKFRVPKLELMRYIAENNLQVAEVTKTQKPKPNRNLTWKQNRRGKWAWFDGETQVSGAYTEESDSDNARQSIAPLRDAGASKYQSYTLTGPKQNYTELLLTLPQIGRETSTIDGKPVRVPQNEFRSSHFDEPNILTHVRFDDRTDADGKKTLFVEEVQSDWHQKGKKGGYQDSKALRSIESELAEARAEHNDAFNALGDEVGAGALGNGTTFWDRTRERDGDYVKIGHIGSDHKLTVTNDATPEQRAGLERIAAAEQRVNEIRDRQGVALKGVPDAPFKTDWHELAMKRMLRYAAEHGYEKLAWVTGQQTADRYDLSKQVHRVDYFPKYEGGTLSAYDKDGREVISRKGIGPDQLADYIGKDAATKLLNSPMNNTRDHWRPERPSFDFHSIGGQQLRVGGEWAKRLYDQAIPNFINKVAKKFGAKAGETKLKIGTNDDALVEDYERNNPGSPLIAANRAMVHSVDITPEMRHSVVYEGQPLFTNDPYNLIRDRSPQAWAKIIDASKLGTIEPGHGLRKVVTMNSSAMQVVSKAVGFNFAGVSMSPRSVEKTVERLNEWAAELKPDHPEAADKLRAIAKTLTDNMDKAAGTTVVPQRGGIYDWADLKVRHEEMMHAELQQAPGKGDLLKSIPVELAEDPLVRAMAPRISGSHNENPYILVTEAFVDAAIGTHPELSQDQAEQLASKYYDKLAEKFGLELLHRAQAIQDYIDEQVAASGIIEPGQEKEYEDFNAGGRRALTKAIEKAGRAGAPGRGEKTAHGGEGSERSEISRGETEEHARSAAAGNEDVELRGSAGTPERRAAGTNEETAGQSLVATHSVGLTDEELEDWSKSKGFRVEPAGEQLGMFGGSEPVMRVFRINRGKEQAGLVYQSQLDNLKKTQASEPAGEFQLIGEETPEEQPRLFGAGDLGEILGPTGKKVPSGKSEEEDAFSLFHNERGEFEPGKLSDAAQKAIEPVRDYLRSEVINNRIARELHSGMYDLESQYSADVLRAVHTMRATLKEAGPNAAKIFEGIYHHLEDPQGQPLTKEQGKFLDDVIIPIAEDTDDKFTRLQELLGKADANLIENYVHRVVKGKGAFFDRILSGIKGTGRGNLLTKTSPQTKHRTMMALERNEGIYKKRMVVSIKGGQVTAWQNGHPENLGGISHTDEGRVWQDKDGGLWTLRQATTKEIEQHTDLRYFHNALASVIVSNLQVRKALRGAEFINTFKNSPEFSQIAMKVGTGNPPNGWRVTQLPQMRDYYFEPHTAEVLDWYASRIKGQDPNIFGKLNSFLRTSIFFNPLIHIPNISVHWLAEKGPSGYVPTTAGTRTYRTSMKALNAVIHQNQDFLDALDAGAPLQSHREDTAQLTELFFDQLSDGLDKKEPWATEIAKAVGMSPVELTKAVYKFSGKATWVTNDIAFLQSAYEKVEAGMDLKTALHETAKHIPDYRLPVRILNSATLGKLLSNNAIAMFMAYHYGALRSYAEMAKSALGANEPPPGSGRSKAGEVAHGWELLLGVGLITFFLYPLIADPAAQKITGDKRARWRRAGAATAPYNLYMLATHQKSASDVLQSIITPAVGTKTAVELAMNRDLYSGRRIYNLHDTWKDEAQDVGRKLMEAVSPVGQAARVYEGGERRKRALFGMLGISFPKTRAERMAADFALERIGTAPMSEKQEEEYSTRRDVLDALRKGDYGPLDKALDEGKLTPQKARELRHRAMLTPLEDTTERLSYQQVLQVREAAQKDGSEDEVIQLDRVLAKKRRNMWRRHEQVPEEAKVE